MSEWEKYPARVSRAVAKELLGVACDRTFNKIVDSCPDLCHRLPGETRTHYRLIVIRRLMSSQPAVCDPREGVNRHDDK